MKVQVAQPFGGEEGRGDDEGECYGDDEGKATVKRMVCFCVCRSRL